MITIKRIDNNEFNNLITYDLIDRRLKDVCSSHLYFAVIDGNKVLGHALVALFDNSLVAEIIEIYILPQDRNQGLGDGLLRTILNYLQINLYTHVIIQEHKELEGFLINTRAEEVNSKNLTEQVNAILKKSNEFKYYIYDIEEFFSQKCKGSQL